MLHCFSVLSYYFCYMQRKKNTKSNYGALTDISKDLNQFFGDRSGRTVSRRTADGFKNFFNSNALDNDAAEFIVHGGMIAATKLLNSKKETDRSNGFMLSMALFLCYQAGK